MKVGPLNNQLDGRSSGQQNPGKNPPSDTPKHEKGSVGSEQEEALSPEDVAPQKLNELVDSYRSDLQAQGLDASVEGVGPGLKVVLRDSSGGLIRQFTSREFLRLRTSSAKENRNRGKILDQKL
jgi:hypothetical protein